MKNYGLKLVAIFKKTEEIWRFLWIFSTIVIQSVAIMLFGSIDFIFADVSLFSRKIMNKTWTYLLMWCNIIKNAGAIFF